MKVGLIRLPSGKHTFSSVVVLLVRSVCCLAWSSLLSLSKALYLTDTFSLKLYAPTTPSPNGDKFPAVRTPLTHRNRIILCTLTCQSGLWHFYCLNRLYTVKQRSCGAIYTFPLNIKIRCRIMCLFSTFGIGKQLLELESQTQCVTGK